MTAPAHYPLTRSRAITADLCTCTSLTAHPYGIALAGPAEPTRIGVRATPDHDTLAHAAAGWGAYVYVTAPGRDAVRWLPDAAQAHAWPDPLADLARDALTAYVAAGAVGPIHLWKACDAPTGPGSGLPVVGSPWGPVTCHACLTSRLLAIGRETLDRETGLTR